VASLGKVIDHGRLRYTSPSAIKTFQRCARSWAFRYVAGIRQPTTPAQQKGIDGHARIEHYLRTGENVLTDLERPGKIWIPNPSESIIVEPSIDVSKPIATISGVPLIGKLDCLNTDYYVDPQGDTHVEDFPEILDWKFSSDPERWGLTPADIQTDIAMNAYGIWALTRSGGDRVRLSLVYFSTRRRYACKRTAVISREHCNKVIDSYAPTVAAMKQAAQVSDPNDLDPSLDACRAFGGCPYQGDCVRSNDAVIRSLFQTPKPSTTRTDTMSLLDQMSMTDRIAALEAQEQQEKGPDVGALLQRISAHGVGVPTYRREAMKAVAQVMGWEVKGAALLGSGKLANVTISTVDEIVQLVEELDARAAVTKSDDPPSALPPEATLPAPEEAAVPIPPEETLSLTPEVRAEVEAPPVAPKAEVEAPPTAPKKPGRPATAPSLARLKKAELLKAALELEARVAELEAGTGAAPAKTEASEFGGVELWVNCMPSFCGTQPISAYIDAKLAEVAKAGKAPHVLAAAADSPLAYGKWRGYLSAAVQADPPPPDRYHLQGRGDIVDALVDALRAAGARVHLAL